MIYKNIGEACEAREAFHKEYDALMEKYGADFWENDDVSGSGYSFEYRDGMGNIKTLY